jgi:hypothetical protein
LRESGHHYLAEQLVWEGLETAIALSGEGHKYLSWSQLFDVFEAADDFLGQDSVLTIVQNNDGEKGALWQEDAEIMLARLAQKAAADGDDKSFDGLVARMGGSDEGLFLTGDAPVFLARGFLALGRTTEAIDLLSRCLALFHPRYRHHDPVLLAETLVSAGMVGEAIALTRQSLPPGSLAAVALVLAKAGHPEAADWALRQAMVDARSETEIFQVLEETFRLLACRGEAEAVLSLVEAVLEVRDVRPAEQTVPTVHDKD